MDDSREARLRRQQIAGLLLLALLVLIVATLRARHGDLFPPGWWRW
jgi:hypothetical protein